MSPLSPAWNWRRSVLSADAGLLVQISSSAIAEGPWDALSQLKSCQPYFYFRSSWLTDLETVSHDAHLAMIVSTKFEVDTTIRCLVIAADTLRDLDLWPFDFGPWSYMAGHVLNPSTKFEDPTAIRSWQERAGHLLESHAEFLLSVIELLFLSVMVEAVQGKMCQNLLRSLVGRSLGAKISGGRGRRWGIFFGFYKTRHILLSNSANCTVLHAVILTQYRRVTDGRTDRRNCCS